MEPSPLQSKSFLFAVVVVRAARALQEEAREFTLSKQLLRSGTAIGALLAESTNAQSRADFISKQHIALKEARETLYWLRLLHETDYLPNASYQKLHSSCDELVRMLTASLRTLKGITNNPQEGTTPPLPSDLLSLTWRDVHARY